MRNALINGDSLLLSGGSSWAFDRLKQRPKRRAPLRDLFRIGGDRETRPFRYASDRDAACRTARGASP
jgi:hypothetical protein